MGFNDIKVTTCVPSFSIMCVKNDIDPEMQAIIMEEGRVLKNRVSYELLAVQTSGYYVSCAHPMAGAVRSEVEGLLVMVTVSTPVEQLNIYITNKWPLEKLVMFSSANDRIHRDMAALAGSMTSCIHVNGHIVLGITVEVTTFKEMAVKFPYRKI